MTFDDLTPEVKDKVKSCTSIDELVALAKSEGVELTDDQLSAVSGGTWEDVICTSNTPTCFPNGDDYPW